MLSELDPPNSDVFRSFILSAMEATGLDASNLARRAKLQPSTITRILRDDHPATMRQRTIEAIARVAGIPAPHPSAANATPIEHTRGRRQVGQIADVPVQTLIGSPIPELYYLNHAATDYAPRPPSLARASRAFAVRMPDDTMEGWRRPNELIYLDPLRAVGEGDHALVEFGNQGDPNAPGLCAIRRIARRRGNEITLGRWGFDPGETTYRRTDIVSMTRVIEWPELLAT